MSSCQTRSTGDINSEICNDVLTERPADRWRAQYVALRPCRDIEGRQGDAGTRAIDMDAWPSREIAEEKGRAKAAVYPRDIMFIGAFPVTS